MPERKKSSVQFKKAQAVMVGGVNSPVRAFKGVGGEPLIMSHGRGKRLVDLDGNAYTDYCLSWGALILGHHHPAITKAAAVAVSMGSSFGTTTVPEIELATLITKCIPSIDKIRFVNSGTEATMSAVRLARGFTKRSKVIKFDGCYHGHADDLLASAGSGVSGLPQSSSDGVPPSHVANTLSLPYNDIHTLTNTIERHWKDIACVIIEPVAGNMGVIVPDAAFLKVLRAITKKYGIVLIFDEVMTGFRTGVGGAQVDFGITPDLTCLGKIIGGGYPVGAYGGRKDIMAHLAPEGHVYQAGTFAGNPIVMRAGIAVLGELNKGTYTALNILGDDFTARTNTLLASINAPAILSNYRSMVSIRFKTAPVRNYDDARSSSDNAVYARLFHSLLNDGIYLPPADLETFFISTMHKKSDLNLLSSKIHNFFVQSVP